MVTTKQVAVRLREDELLILDRAVASGRYPNRAEALRGALALLGREARDSEIAAAYRRGYGSQAQEEWVGEAGAAAAGEVIADREQVRPRL